MPKPFDPHVAGMPGAVYSALAHRLATHPGETYPLHVGDTWREPTARARMQAITVADHPGMHKYVSPLGWEPLRQALAARMSERMGSTTPDEVWVTAGGTGGLAALVKAVLSPGDEVVILAPHWPLIAGMATAFGATPVRVPVLVGTADAPLPTTAAEAAARVAAAITPRTRALYLNTPNNPTGRILPVDWVRALVEVARDHDLWILADEVYDLYAFDGPHHYVRPLAPERTVSIFSASKAYGMAGNRVGWLVGPAEALAEARKVGTHTFYSAPTAGQIALHRALDGEGDAWAAESAATYRQLGNYAADRLGVAPPEGSTFLFVDVADHLGDDGLDGLLERCVDQGLLVAPGPAFGPYPHHVRVCFTSVEPDRVRRGVDVLAGLLGR